MYNLKDKDERELYLKQKEKQYKRFFNDKTIQENFIEQIKDNQEMIKYILDKRKIQNDIEKQIENELPLLLEKALNKIFK